MDKVETNCIINTWLRLGTVITHKTIFKSTVEYYLIWFYEPTKNYNKNLKKTHIIRRPVSNKKLLFIILIFFCFCLLRGVQNTLLKIIHFNQTLILWQIIYKQMHRIAFFSGDITLMHPTFELPRATEIIDCKTLIQRRSLNSIIALNVNCPKKRF